MIRSAIMACGLFAFGLAAHANSIVFALGSSNNQNYSYGIESNIPVGPFPGTLTNSSLTLFYSMDMSLSTSWNTPSKGSDANPAGQIQEEAAFLATVEMFDAGSSSTQKFVNTVEGPISLAIWQLFGNMGSYPTDPAAALYIQQAQYAWNHLLNNPQNTPAQNAMVQTWLSDVLIFTPNTLPSTQRFLGAFQDNAIVLAALPEPSTLALFGIGLALIALRRTRQLKPVPVKSR